MTTDGTERRFDDEESIFTTGRRRFLQAAGISAAGLTGLGGIAAGQSDGGHIELDAVTIEVNGRGRSEYAWEDGEDGIVRGPPEAVCDAQGGNQVWMGVSPDSIANVANPTLDLTPGETYTVEWTNVDGDTHNFVIVDDNGDELVSSDDVTEEGETQTVEFEATEEMAEYYCGTHPGSQRGTVDVGPDDVNLLAISITTGWTHRNIPYGIQRLKDLEDDIADGIGADTVTVDTVPEDPPDNYEEDPLTDAPESFSDVEFWNQYDAVIWFNTTGNVLAEDDERAAFEEYMANGGGYVGIHAAADTHRGAQDDNADEWQFYIDMLGGATFVDHPSNQDAQIHVSDQDHPSTDHLPEQWDGYDEWYNYAENPRGDVHVLATLDESSYDMEGSAGAMGADHPIAWAKEYAGGRAWYTGRGHTEEVFDEELFVDHVIGGIGWATGLLEGDVSVTPFEVSGLDPTEATVGQGDTLDVSATITNNGDMADEQDVELSIGGTVVGTRTVSLDANSQETITFEDASTGGIEPGEYEFAVRSESHLASGTVTVEDVDAVNLLLFSATAGFRHGNIEYGLERLEAQADRIAELADVDTVNIDTIAEDASAFPSDASELEQYDTIVWFNTVDNVLDDDDQRAAFEEYIQNGGGYAGIHAASDTHHPDGGGNWDFYQGLIGDAYFVDHPISEAPQIQEAQIRVTDRVHPSTDHLPARWNVEDEWYNNATNPRGDVHVLATVDESTYDLGATEGMGEDHPIAWCQEYQGGRAWYTGRGHTEAAFDEDAFIEHVLGGILWSGGFLEGDATGTVWDSYEKSQITGDLGEGMKMDTTPDGRLFFTERISGEVSVYDPDSEEISTALSLDVYSQQEDGLQGIKFDPDFENNGWVYIYYSPAEDALDPDDDMPYNVLSRFTVDGDEIDPDSETEIIRVHTQRETCCHVGGDIDFGPDGEELYLSTGDDTNPFQSDAYTPIDERDGRKNFDAQRTAANTNDLRGSILRIVPNEDGSYDIPDGNLFTGDEYAGARADGLVREEIYLMGCRNPFTMKVDDESGLLYYADYGPDAGEWDAERGPPGIVEFNVVEEPGFHGWPYFTGSNIPYVDGSFVDADNDAGYVFESDGAFDPANPVNDSPNNTGLEELPPAEAATMFYAYPSSMEGLYNNVPSYAEEYVPESNPWPELSGGGGAPMAGPLFRDADGFGENGLPEYYDGKWFIMEWNQGWLKYVSFDDEEEVLDIEPFLPTEDYIAPQDMVVGADGQLYLLEFGAGFEDPDNPGLYVIERTDDGDEGEPGNGDPDPDPDPVSVPYGFDSGGETHEDPVSIDGLDMDKLPNDAVTQTGTHNTTSLLEAEDDFEIDGTDNDVLYKTEHYGDGIGYDIEVPNGTYDVTLHFAELWWGIDGRGGTDTGVGDRIFDVSIQGTEVLSDYDIYDEAGSLTATTETFEGIEVTDGTLSITSNTQEDNTKFAAIEIHEADDDGGGADGLDPATTIQVDGLSNPSGSSDYSSAGWHFTAPDAVTDDPNPTLTLREGEEYTVEWTTVDGAAHDFDIQDADGNTLVDTDLISGAGTSASVSFTVTAEMASYICSVHPSSMIGDIEVV